MEAKLEEKAESPKPKADKPKKRANKTKATEDKDHEPSTSSLDQSEPQNKKKKTPGKTNTLTAAKKAELKKMIYQFKISLLDTDVWRRIQISGKSTLHDLQQAIHKSMGWLGVHAIHHFQVKNPKTDAIEHYAIPGAIMEFGESTYKNEKTAHIIDYFINPNDKALYMYTFGEGWEHEVLLEKIIIPAVNTTYPKCTGGKLACPPEDCGGVDGYHRIVGILADPKHEEYEETLDWLKDQDYRNYDPNKFVPRNVFKVKKPQKMWIWAPARGRGGRR